MVHFIKLKLIADRFLIPLNQALLDMTAKQGEVIFLAQEKSIANVQYDPKKKILTIKINDACLVACQVNWLFEITQQHITHFILEGAKQSLFLLGDYFCEEKIQIEANEITLLHDDGDRGNTESQLDAKQVHLKAEVIHGHGIFGRNPIYGNAHLKRLHLEARKKLSLHGAIYALGAEVCLHAADVYCTGYAYLKRVEIKADVRIKLSQSAEIFSQEGGNIISNGVIIHKGALLAQGSECDPPRFTLTAQECLYALGQITAEYRGAILLCAAGIIYLPEALAKMPGVTIQSSSTHIIPKPEQQIAIAFPIRTIGTIIVNTMLILLPIIFGPAAATLFGTRMVQYAYPVYQLLDGHFSNKEKVLIWPALMLLMGGLSQIGLTSVVQLMLTDSCLVLENIKNFLLACGKQKMILQESLLLLLRWLLVEKNEESLSTRFLHMLLLLLIAPFNNLFLTSITYLNRSGSDGEKLLVILSGLLKTFSPALCYTNVISQSVDYVQGESQDQAISVKDIFCAAASFITHHFCGDSLSVNRVLNQSLAHAKKQEVHFSFFMNHRLRTQTDWIRQGASPGARLLNLGAHLAEQTIIELAATAAQWKLLLPRNFAVTFTLVSQYYSSLDYFSRYALSYGLSIILEKFWPSLDILGFARDLFIANSIRVPLLKTMASYFAKTNDEDMHYVLEIFCHPDHPKRTTIFKLFDFILDGFLVFMSKKIFQWLKECLPEAVQILADWIYYYLEQNTRYFMELYADIESRLFFTDQARLTRHIEELLYLAEESMHVFRLACAEIQSSMHPDGGKQLCL